MRGGAHAHKIGMGIFVDGQPDLPVLYKRRLYRYRNFRSATLRLGLVMEIIMKRAISLFLVTIILAGCGTDPGERTLSGAGIGAGVGVVGGALVGAPLAGAAIGAGAGAVTGAVTSPNQINLNNH